MSLVKCPKCGRERVSDLANGCPGCGYNLKLHFYPENNSANHAENQIQEENTDSANAASKRLALIVCGSVIMLFVALWFFSTRCKQDGCFRTKAEGSNYCSYHQSSFDNYLSSLNSISSYDDTFSKQKGVKDFKISDITVYTNSAATYCKGTIKNNGTSTRKFVKLKGSFKDKNGNTIETGDTYAVGDEGLAPDESTTFSISAHKNMDVESCDVSVYDYD